jgi:hypothetical protein
VGETEKQGIVTSYLGSSGLRDKTISPDACRGALNVTITFVLVCMAEAGVTLV